MDEGIAKVSDRNYQVRVLPEPNVFTCDSIDQVSVPDFLQGVCRPLDIKVVKSASVIFDVHLGIVERGSANVIGQHVAKGNLAELPPPLAFANIPPETSKVDIIIHNTGDGCVNVLKVIYLEKSLSSNAAISMCSGKPFVPVFRSGPHGVKKAVQRALARVSGHHVQWRTLDNKSQGALQKSTSTTWSVENDDLAAGIRFINSFAPECDAVNEQTFCILTNIKPDSGTPVAGWPKVKVRAMCQNKSRRVSGAASHNEFPLNTSSLNSVLVEIILPLVYPLLLSTAILMLGNPGVGKTPAIITMAMAIGRYHIRRLDLQGVKPGWRRAKSLDNFRQRSPQIQEGLFLDDPAARRLDIAELKAFVTADEDGTVSGRCNDARLTRNQFRALASNDTGEEPVGVRAQDTTLDPELFFKLITPLFDGAHKKDILAVTKRCTIFVFTSSAFYLRLPSECPTATVHRIDRNDLRLDLLAQKDKELYGNYKRGVTMYSFNHASEVEREQAMIDARVEYMGHFASVKNYVDHSNDALQSWLRPVRVLPPSPDSPEQPQQPNDLHFVKAHRRRTQSKSSRSRLLRHARGKVPPHPRKVQPRIVIFAGAPPVHIRRTPMRKQPVPRTRSELGTVASGRFRFGVMLKPLGLSSYIPDVGQDCPLLYSAVRCTPDALHRKFLTACLLGL